ncbi:coiled-coil domain-containing protein 150-like [Watersipora subatra]|uniref:coiled-coil domain-containing protein 150-like n=1 Tax=Watersipora subatra TaxID=2589382 RepID=UPI00355C1ECF
MDETIPKSVIPISKNVVQMMQNRLEEVEDSATQLTQEIVAAKQSNSSDRLSILLSKTQSMESVLQTLKLNFVNLSTLTRQPSDLEQKLVEMTDVYTEELKKVTSENAHLKTDKQELNEKRQQTELDLQRVRITLEQLKSIQTEKDDAIQAERKRVESLLKKVAELDLQLAEERQLRFGLDRANSELGQKLDEMGLLLKQEHLETQNFTGDFIKMKKDYTKKCEELKEERNKQKEMETEMITVCQELDAKLTELEAMREEKRKITSTMSTVHEKYKQLNSQLETMQNLFTDYQKEKQMMEGEIVKIQTKMEELELENADLRQQLLRAQKNDESARLIDVRQQLRHMTKERDGLIADNELLTERVTSLEVTCQQLDKELEEFKRNADKETESKFAVIGGLQERLSGLKAELMSLEGEKESLLTEVNGAVDAMDGERTALQAELESLREQLSTALEELEEEKSKSRDLEKKMTSFGLKPDFMHFDRRLSELTEQKNTLSYENGKLQSQLEQVQGQLEAMASDQKRYEKVNKKLGHAENKIKKLSHELRSCKQTLSQSESTCQQLQTSCETRETDFNSMKQSRDAAQKDARLLTARLEALEEALQQQEEIKAEVEDQLKEDNSKVTESLENMMALHTDLQCKYESLQIELGKKDTQLTEHKKERKRQQDKLSRVENQLEVLSEKLTDVEGKQSNQAKNLQREIKTVKIDNSKLVRTLQDTLELNEQLRAQVALLEETLCKQRVECDKLKVQSKDIDSKLRQQDLSYAARIAELEAQLSQEWDKASQHVQVKSSENAELSKKNDDLKIKVKSLKADVCKLKGEIKHKTQKIHKLQDTEKEMKRLYTSNEELSSHCRVQEKTISKFVSQFKEVQSEMRELATLHSEQTESLEETKRLLDAEKMRCDELRRKYHECKKEVASLQELLRATEVKLVEANNDTQIATETLEDTNRYFKERFSALSGELSSAKKQHLDLEWKNMDKQHRLLIERQRADETTSKARDMIKVARKHLTNMADRTDFDQSTREDHSRLTLTPTAYESTLSNTRRNDSMEGNSSLEQILSVSQRRYQTSNHPAQPLSPFTSSSQKLDAIIGEMEKRRLIS